MGTCRNNIKSGRIGVLGGTFDPVHYGHLVAAEAARVEFDLEKVIIIPSGNPPHKQEQKITEPEHRYNMAVLAASSNPAFGVSGLEIGRGGISYTVDTVKDLKGIYGEDADIFFIIGADEVIGLSSWHRIRELAALCKFIVASRPGFDNFLLEQNIMEISSEYNAKMFCIEIPLLAISSTDIRNRVRNGKPIKYLLPEKVENYIKEKGLYREG